MWIILALHVPLQEQYTNYEFSLFTFVWMAGEYTIAQHLISIPHNLTLNLQFQICLRKLQPTVGSNTIVMAITFCGVSNFWATDGTQQCM